MSDIDFVTGRANPVPARLVAQHAALVELAHIRGYEFAFDFFVEGREWQKAAWLVEHVDQFPE